MLPVVVLSISEPLKSLVILCTFLLLKPQKSCCTYVVPCIKVVIKPKFLAFASQPLYADRYLLLTV